MATSTRQRLIDTAHDLFYEEGFHTVGLDRILAEVGVTKTTFYNHFGSKDDLMLEVLNHHDRWWRDTFAQKLRDHGGDTPRGQLEAVFDVVKDLINGDDYNGCIFINVAVEFPLPHDPVHQAAAQHKQAMEAIIRELAGYAGAGDPAAFAQELSLLMEGAYVTQQVTRNAQTADIARRIADMVVDKHLPAAAA
ncbi:MAG: TetR/AcrR family transcriptional regulator [Planctomycetota bacterium]|jgi:AcrR family transcriptional regulator